MDFGLESYTPNRIQKEFHSKKSNLKEFWGRRGLGKTTALCYEAAMLSSTEATKGLILAGSMFLAKDVIVPYLLRFIADPKIDMSSLKLTTKSGSTIHVGSLRNVTKWRGMQFDWIGVDYDGHVSTLESENFLDSNKHFGSQLILVGYQEN